jgi:DNA polymerase-3 subunit alpha
MDLLGLSNMSMLSEAMKMLGMDLQGMYDIPLEDDETLRGFRENDVVGIFQFDGRAMRTVNDNLKPDNFYEVCVVTALARPGPLHSRATHFYVETKHGLTKPEKLHPLFDNIVSHTQWQVVYQEQILRIVREIGNFDWTAASHIRKIISQKIGEQAFNREWERFWKGAKENGLDRETAKRIWNMCITAGTYAFNAAHSVSYGMIAWWTMWIKRHHPLVFYMAALKHLPKTKHLELMRDASKHGVKVVAPDWKRSGTTWRRDTKSNTLVAGFSQVPGIGEKTGKSIVVYRKKIGLTSWDDMINIKGIGPKTIDKIKEFVDQEDPLGVHILDKKLAKVIAEIKSKKLKRKDGETLVPLPTHRSEEIPTTSGPNMEITWIGVVTYRNLRDLFEVYYSRNGVQLDPKTVKHAELREWCMMHGYDGGEAITLRVDRYKYEKFKKAIWDLRLGKDLVLVRGYKRGDLPLRLIYVRDMIVFEG